MADTITIRLNVSIGLVGCTRTKDIKVDREEWAEMADSERDEYMREELNQLLEWGYDEV